MLMGSLMMTAPNDGIVGGNNADAAVRSNEQPGSPVAEPANVDAPIGYGAGEIGTEEVFPDTTEGNRGPSRTANSSGNIGDPTVELHGDAGTIVEGSASDEPVIPNSTNAVTDMAYQRLSPATEVIIKLERTLAKDYDVRPFFVELLGTTNVTPGPMNSAFRSINFKFPEGHGQRAIIVYRDGTAKLLASGTGYADWYAQTRDPDVACAAIAYFDQRPTAENPFVAIRWYKRDELPAVAVEANDL